MFCRQCGRKLLFRSQIISCLSVERTTFFGNPIAENNTSPIGKHNAIIHGRDNKSRGSLLPFVPSPGTNTGRNQSRPKFARACETPGAAGADWLSRTCGVLVVRAGNRNGRTGIPDGIEMAPMGVMVFGRRLGIGRLGNRGGTSEKRIIQDMQRAKIRRASC